MSFNGDTYVFLIHCREVETRHANDQNFSPVSKLNEFHQKVKSDRPKYEFDTQACRWTCTVQFEQRTCTGIFFFIYPVFQLPFAYQSGPAD